MAGKSFEDIKIVSTGGGAAGIACLNMLLKLGVKRENVWLCDIHGLVYEGRTEDMNPHKAAFAQKTDKRTLDDVIEGADMFLGLSGPGVLKPEHVKQMTDRPIIFALANPTPEIMPELAPPSKFLGGLGMPGMTAYFGLLDVGQPKPGDRTETTGTKPSKEVTNPPLPVPPTTPGVVG